LASAPLRLGSYQLGLNGAHNMGARTRTRPIRRPTAFRSPLPRARRAKPKLGAATGSSRPTGSPGRLRAVAL